MFKSDTFPGGIHPLEHIHEGKGLTSLKPIQDLAAPEHLLIPLSQSAGTTCEPLVQKGDRVLRGQKIGQPRGFVGAPVHASVSGTVVSIEQKEISNGVFCQCILLANDFLDETCPPISTHTLEDKADTLLKAAQEAGIVGMGGAAFPTHIKLSPPSGKVVDTVIVNGAECEPYLTGDHRVMVESSADVVLGLTFAMRILGAKRGLIGIEKNKPDAILALSKACVGKANLTVRPLQVKYPQGSEKHLILAATARQVPSGALPADAGCVVINVSTAVALAQALAYGRPLTERVVTVTGRVAQPQNLRVRIGTPISHLIKACGGLLEDTARLLSGGPMMGIALFSQDVPVVKATSSILALSHDDATPGQGTACIRCGRCATGCPMHLMPMKIANAAKMQDWDAAAKFNALDCIECGSCTFSCPAKKEIVANVRVAKRVLIARLKR